MKTFKNKKNVSLNRVFRDNGFTKRLIKSQCITGLHTSIGSVVGFGWVGNRNYAEHTISVAWSAFDKLLTELALWNKAVTRLTLRLAVPFDDG